jgi:hypothetical protein
MQTRGGEASWPRPQAGLPPESQLGPTPALLPSCVPVAALLASPALPHPLCNLKGNKYKLYKVKGVQCCPGAAGLLQRWGREPHVAPHIIPSCSNVLA